MEGGLPKMDPGKVESKDLCGVYSEIANLLGIDVALKLHSAYHGQQISFPVHFYSNEYLARLIISEYDGTNVKQLATKYNYSEKWIRKIIKEGKDEKNEE